GGGGPAGHVRLAQQYKPLARAVLQQRAVLQRVAAVEDRQEVAARRLLDEHRRDVAPTAAAPGPWYVDAAPLHRRAVPGTHHVGEPRWEDRRLAAPVVQVLGVEPGQDGMIRDSREDLPQA